MKPLIPHGAKSASTFAWAVLGLVLLALAGCSDKDVTALKAETLSEHSSFTIGQAFDHRNACASVSWSEDTDDRGRKIITYRCIFKVDPTIYTRYQKRRIQFLAERATRLHSLYPEDKQDVANMKAAIKRIQNAGTIVGASEVFQWAKNGGGYSSIYAGRDIRRSDGSTKSFPYGDVDIAINAIVSNKATDLSTYANETNGVIAPSL